MKIKKFNTHFFKNSFSITLVIAIFFPFCTYAQYHKYPDFCMDSIKTEQSIFLKRHDLFTELNTHFYDEYSEAREMYSEDKALIEFKLDTFCVNERGRIIEAWLSELSHYVDEYDTLCPSISDYHWSTPTAVSMDFRSTGYLHLIDKYNKKILEMTPKSYRKLMQKEIDSWSDWHNSRLQLLINDLDEAYMGGGTHVAATYPVTEVEWLKDRVNILGGRFVCQKLVESLRTGY